MTILVLKQKHAIGRAKLGEVIMFDKLRNFFSKVPTPAANTAPVVEEIKPVVEVATPSFIEQIAVEQPKPKKPRKPRKPRVKKV